MQKGPVCCDVRWGKKGLLLAICKKGLSVCASTHADRRWAHKKRQRRQRSKTANSYPRHSGPLQCLCGSSDAQPTATASTRRVSIEWVVTTATRGDFNLLKMNWGKGDIRTSLHAPATETISLHFVCEGFKKVYFIVGRPLYSTQHQTTPMK